MKIKLEDIRLKERIRIDLGDIVSLADSIKSVGLINPILLDEDNYLIAGQRRLEAVKLLGWEEIPCTRVSELSEFDKKRIELEENVHRKELHWTEEVRAKKQLHELYVDLYGKARKGPGGSDDAWTVRKTAEMLEESVGSVSQDLRLADAVDEIPSLADIPSKFTALNKLKILEQATQSQLDTVSSIIERSTKIEEVEILQGDCRELLSSIPSNSIDLIITDPPYGVDLDKDETWKKTHEKIYECEDSEEHIFKELLPIVFPELFRVLREGRHIYLFCPTKYKLLVQSYLLLEKAGFSVQQIPLMWKKGTAAHRPTQQYRRFVVSYETVIFGWKGKQRMLTEAAPSAIFSFEAPHKRIHPLERPTGLIKRFLELSSYPKETVLDCFAGSGVVGSACKSTGRKAILMEESPEYAAMMRLRIFGE